MTTENKILLMDFETKEDAQLFEDSIENVPTTRSVQSSRTTSAVPIYDARTALGDDPILDSVYTRDTLGYVRVSRALLFGEGFTVDGNMITMGNVGIGTTTPTEKLHVVGNVNLDGDMFTTGNVGIGTTNPNTLLTFYKDYPLPSNGNQPAEDTTQGITFRSDLNSFAGSPAPSWTKLSTPVDVAKIWFQPTSYQNISTEAGVHGTLNFGTGRTGTLSDTPAMSITTEGRIGIGGNPTNFNFTVSDVHLGDDYDPNKYGMLQITRPGTLPDEKYYLSFVRGGNTVTGMGHLPGSNTFGIMRGGVNSSTGLFLTSNGNVGIGTTNPDTPLHVNGDLRTSVLYVGEPTGSGTIYMGGGAGGDGNYQHSVIETRNYSSTESTELLLFKGNDPSGSAGPDRIRLRAGAIQFDTYPNATVDRTAENIRMTITDAGNVGIGTITPREKLHVEGKVFLNTIEEELDINLIGEISTSTWISRSIPNSNSWTSVTWSQQLSLFVAVASEGNSNRVMTSPDGINWTTRQSANSNNWISVIWASGLSLFVAVATGGSATLKNVMTSPDGINWTERQLVYNNNWSSITWSPELSLLVVVASFGNSNRVMTSSNGINWTERSTPTNNEWRSVTWVPELSLFVAVASYGDFAETNRVMTSPNGVTWTARPTPNKNGWWSVTWSPDLSLLVAVASSGDGNRVMTSPNGVTWTARATPSSNTWRSVTWSPQLSLFVAVASEGDSNRVMTSPDGINWTTRTSSNNNAWWSITWAPQLYLFVAVAYSTSGNRVITSTDVADMFVITPQLDLNTDSARKLSTSTWLVGSDERLKTNIQIADYDKCYDVLKRLDLKYFQWRDDIKSLDKNKIPDRHKLGWIAQEVEVLFPKAVQTVPELHGIKKAKTLNSDQIYAVMYGAIKKLIQLYESYEEQLTQLSEKNESQQTLLQQEKDKVKQLETTIEQQQVLLQQLLARVESLENK